MPEYASSNLFPRWSLKVSDNGIHSEASVVFCGGGCHSGAGAESRAQMSCAQALISCFPWPMFSRNEKYLSSPPEVVVQSQPNFLISTIIAPCTNSKFALWHFILDHIVRPHYPRFRYRPVREMHQTRFPQHPFRIPSLLSASQVIPVIVDPKLATE